MLSLFSVDWLLPEGMAAGKQNSGIQGCLRLQARSKDCQSITSAWSYGVKLGLSPDLRGGRLDPHLLRGLGTWGIEFMLSISSVTGPHP